MKPSLSLKNLLLPPVEFYSGVSKSTRVYHIYFVHKNVSATENFSHFSFEFYLQTNGIMGNFVSSLLAVMANAIFTGNFWHTT